MTHISRKCLLTLLVKVDVRAESSGAVMMRNYATISVCVFPFLLCNVYSFVTLYPLETYEGDGIHFCENHQVTYLTLCVPLPIPDVYNLFHRTQRFQFRY